MNNIMYTGIDVSTTSNVVCSIDPEGNIQDKIRSFPQNQSGAKSLESWLDALVSQGGFDRLLIATEATSFYDLPIIDYLAESQRLGAFKPELYRLNAKYVKRFRQSMGEKDKTDLVDARVIAEKLRSGVLPHPYLSHQLNMPLQRLTRYRVHLVEVIAREKQHMLAHLFLKYVGYKKDNMLENQVFGKTSQAVLTEFKSSEDLANCSIEELTDFVVEHGKNRSARPQEIARSLKSMARESYRIRPALAKSVNLILISSLRSIRSLQETLKEINQAISDELKAFPQTLESIPGIGPVYAAGILAEIGNVERFPSSDQLAKFSGIWWPRHQSGEFEAEDRRLRKAGNKYLRYYLVEAANSARIHNLEYKEYYQKKYKEVTKHQHKRALILTARKLIRPVYALLKRGELYRGNTTQSSSV